MILPAILSVLLSLAQPAAQEKGVPSGDARPAPAVQDRPGDGIVPTQDWIRRDADPEKVATSIELLLMITVLSLAPALLMLLTSFTRIVIVLSFIRRALATPDLPPNAVVVGLSVILTFLVMSPVAMAVKRDALDPYAGRAISQQEALARAETHARGFMFRHAREQDLALFMEVSDRPRKPEGWTEDDVPTEVLVPAFVISELRRAFTMGFALFLPFVVIDLAVAAVLGSMGMVMLPPTTVSMPFKLLLFILVDGWALVVGSLVASFR